MNARATRFPLFDSLRAIAALTIFGTHAYFSLRNNADTPLRPYAARLDVGVYIFLVISGFLLYRPFVRARMRKTAAPATKAYAWRRLLRIGPAYWVALTVVALWFGWSYVFEPGNAVWFYPFGQAYRPGLAIAGLTQAWSLTVEAAFYVMLPLWALAMRALPARSERGVLRSELGGLALLVVMGIGFTTLAAATGITAGRLDIVPLHLILPSYLHVFAAGMLLAVLSIWYEERDLPSAIRPLDRFPGIAWAVALLAFWIVSTKIGIDGSNGERQSTAQWVGPQRAVRADRLRRGDPGCVRRPDPRAGAQAAGQSGAAVDRADLVLVLPLPPGGRQSGGRVGPAPQRPDRPRSVDRGGGFELLPDRAAVPEAEAAGEGNASAAAL